MRVILLKSQSFFVINGENIEQYFLNARLFFLFIKIFLIFQSALSTFNSLAIKSS